MSKILINTSQNVNISFDLASIGDRIFAQLIDHIIRGLYIILCLYLFYDFITHFDISFTILILLPVLLYTLVLESIMEGQTFGKKIMKIKVIKIDGYQAGFSDYFIRWIFSLIDVLFGMGLIGILVIIFSKNYQRIGGIISGTAVISLKNRFNIQQSLMVEVEKTYQPTYPQVIQFSDNDMRIIKENFRKSLSINDLQTLNLLKNKIEEILNLKYEGNSPKEFILKIIKDYNHYTGQEENLK